MKFEEALMAMREGKEIKRKGWSKGLSIIPIVVFDKDPCLTSVELNEADIIAEDWEIA